MNEYEKLRNRQQREVNALHMRFAFSQEMI